MSIENDLKDLIIQKSNSIRQFALDVGIPVTTIQSMLNSGIENAGVKKVMKICDYLGIDTDALADGYIKEKMVSPSDITRNEYIHIKKYRALDCYGKKQVDNVLQNEYDRVKEQSMEIAEETTPYMFTKTEYLTGLSAGTGLFVFDDVPTQTTEVPQKYKDADFVIGVSGDSMEPTYYDGDKVAVKKQPSVNIGEIGVFMINGDGYIKELGDNVLISHNKKYKDIIIDKDTLCIGKVLGKL